MRDDPALSHATTHVHTRPNSQSTDHHGPAQQRLQAAFGVPVLTDSVADDLQSRRTLAAALRPGRHRPWVLTTLLVGLLLVVGAVSAVRSMPQAVDTSENAPGLTLVDPAGGEGADSGGVMESQEGTSKPGTEGEGAGNPGGAVVVHVAGQVARPGIVTLPLGARVAEAIAAAGGAVGGASLDGLNLARRLNDGEQVYVGTPPQGTPSDTAASAATGGADSALIDLNRASSDDLQQLPRIGPATAEKIIAHREANGNFTSVDQLLDVPGIGERTLDALRDQVRV